MASDNECDYALPRSRHRENFPKVVPCRASPSRAMAPSEQRVQMTDLPTLVSIAALLAVAAALIAQQQQARTAQMVDVRERHFELIKLMLDHPELDYNATDRPPADDRQSAIGMSLWVAHWNTLWHIGKLDEKALRFNLEDLFVHPEAQAWWRRVGAAWSSKGSRRELRFSAIVTEECERAAARAQQRRRQDAEAQLSR